MIESKEILLPGDVYFTGSPPGKEGIVTGLIRRFTEDYREAPTEFTHVGMILNGGNPQNAITVEQTFPQIRISSLQDYRNCHVRIYRLDGYTIGELSKMANQMRDRRGEKYGLLKLCAYAADATINRIISNKRQHRVNLQIFRKIDWTHRYFCSQVVAQTIPNYFRSPDSSDLMINDPLPFSPDDLVDLFDQNPHLVARVAEFNRPEAKK